MECPRCQHKNPADAVFCQECGTRLETACPGCGTANQLGAKFCKKCGQPVAMTPPAAVAGKFSSPRSYTPKHLAEKILTSKSALEGERKQVTVLFADLRGSMELLADRDPEEARKILDPVIERMMEAVHQYEGTVNQVMGDGIMALFGAPLAHEDHAVRACYAALRMQSSIRRYAEEVRRTQGVEVQIRVGVNSGEVVVRSIGSDLRLDYTAVGQTTHVAARMEQLAVPGTIRITADTLRLAECFVEVKPLGPVPVKGLDALIEVYDVVAAGQVRTRLQAAVGRGLSRFVGRDAEMEQLRAALEQVRSGHGQVVAVVGEPGVGKSRLFHELTHSHRVSGCLTLHASSFSYGRATAYLPVIDLLKGYLRIDERDDTRSIRAKVIGHLLALDDALKDMVPPVLWLLDALPEEDNLRWLEPMQRRQYTLDALKRLLLRESLVQPLVLVFEDLHWIDGETQALLDGLVESLPTLPVLLLVNYRPEYSHRWSGKTYYRQLRIDPLPPESAQELLQALVGDGREIAPLKRRLIETTEGNPLFLEESVRTLVETGALAGDRGAYQLTRAVEHLQIPATVQAILAARIDRLPPEDKRLLQAAAVIGNDVPMPLLLAIAETQEDGVRAGLGRLQAAEFVYETRLFPDLEYTFKHALTHEVAYSTLLTERRRMLHARVVETIEVLFADRLAEHVEQLAHHSFRAEAWKKALRYMRQAGQKAASRSAHREAVACLDQALAALAHLPEDRAACEQAIDLRFELRTSLFPLAELSRILAMLNDAARMADSIGDRRRLGRALSLLGNYHYEIAQSASAIDYAERALAIARDVGDPDLEASVTFLLGQAHYGFGNFARAIELLVQNIAVLDGQPPSPYNVGPARLTVTARCFLARSLVEVGHFRQAVMRAEEAMALSEGSDEAFGLAHACWVLGLTHLRLGDLGRAISVLERGFAVAQAKAVSFLLPILGSHLGYAQALAGRIRDGLTLLAQSSEEARSIGRTRVVAWAQEMLAQVYLAGGREADAAVTARDALDASRRIHARGGEARVLWVLADLAARSATPDFDKAQGFYREALHLANELGMRPLAAHCHRDLGKLDLRTGKREQAQEHLTTAATMYREMGMTYWLERAEGSTSC
jgi:class 3 adenylate cyclase/tetratricopeptide (TPR) repeat protein